MQDYLQLLLLSDIIDVLEIKLDLKDRRKSHF